MSDEPTERDVEALAEVLLNADVVIAFSSCAERDSQVMARAVLASDWYAEAIADAVARREGAAEADAILQEYLRLGTVDVLAAALRGDA